MKKIMQSAIVLCFMVVLSLTLVSCQNTAPEADLWENATYLEDTELGSGAKTLTVEVTAGEKTVTLTLHSDSKTVGDALAEHGLIAGEKGAYGLYVKVVNGITADYEVNQSFWSFSKNQEPMTTGVDGAEFSDGECYELVYTK